MEPEATELRRRPADDERLRATLGELTRVSQNSLGISSAGVGESMTGGLRAILEWTGAGAALLYFWDEEVAELLPLAEEVPPADSATHREQLDVLRPRLPALVRQAAAEGSLLAVELPTGREGEAGAEAPALSPALFLPLIYEDDVVGVCGVLGASAAAVHRHLEEIRFVAFALLAGAWHSRRSEEMSRQNRELSRAKGRLELMLGELENRQRMIETFSLELKNANEQLSLYLRCLEEATDGIVIADVNGQILYVNSTFMELNGFGRSELVGREISLLMPPQARREFEEHSWRALMSQGHWQGETRIRKRSGEEYPADVTIASVKDDDGMPAAHIGIFRDATARTHYEAQLVQLANHDPLTGLINRRRLQEELEHQLAEARRHDVRGALLWLDLDQFKEVNDSLGHRAGDELLVTLTASLQEQLRTTDTLARLGGDEFAILLPRCDPSEAGLVAHRILEEIRGHAAVVGGQAVRVTTSIGIAIFPDHGSTSEELLARADLAMYQAKEGGRNRCSVYRFDCDQQARFRSRVAWTHRLREALEEDLFVLFRQPILELENGGPAGCELLLRMRAEERDPFLPGAFLDVAERFGMMQDIDRWVVAAAIRLLAENPPRRSGDWMAVNLSVNALGDDDLPRVIERLIVRAAIDPRRLVIEITETAAIADIRKARRFIDALKALGCRFALDDFGVGFSSLFHLKHLAVDYLKIDGSFVRNLAHDPVDQHLVRAMVEVARALGKETIAEFVEDEATLRMLRELGVDYAQGFHIARPTSMLDSALTAES